MSREIAIGFVTYRPTENLVTRLIKASEMGFAIYLFDNSPEFGIIRNFCQSPPGSTIRHMTCGKNIGLGYGISSICAQACQ